jgi:uncharacterized membrane protein
VNKCDAERDGVMNLFSDVQPQKFSPSKRAVVASNLNTLVCLLASMVLASMLIPFPGTLFGVHFPVLLHHTVLTEAKHRILGQMMGVVGLCGETRFVRIE